MDKIELDEPLVDMLTAFFSHWWNAPGQNTREGAKDWIGSNEGKAAIRAYLAATTSEPVGYIDKHRQKFASADTHEGSSLAKSGWTPVFTTPPAAPTTSEPVAVKALEWQERPNGYMVAQSIVGRYYLDAKDGTWILAGEGVDGAGGAGGAQADHEARIRSALTNPPAAPTAIDVAWQGLSTAPNACHVLACYFDWDVGEWVIDVKMSPPEAPYSLWQPLPVFPTSLKATRETA